MDIAIAAVLFAASTFVGASAMRAYRAAGVQPAFYQGNFEPAVMMACGHGFHTTTAQAIPPSLRAFLDLETDTFSCADLPADVPLVPVTWNGTWYYLYATTALVWRSTGLSWIALDSLVAVLAGLTSAVLYALFRLVAGRSLSIAGTAVLAMSPVNLTSVLSLRDYSKAPFVLAALWILALLLMRERSNRAVYALAAAFGAIVGLGYGFRGDLLVLAPVGPMAIACLLPGPPAERVRRHLTAAALAALAFVVVGAPPLYGLRTAGGCQFHYALLGRTAPLVHEAAVDPALYSFGDLFTDTFVDLKTGDFANRAMQRRAPQLCAPEYDEASGALFRRYATAFPADLATHAIGAVLTITRSGFEIPDMPLPLPSWLEGRLARRAYPLIQAATHVTSVLGPLLTIAAFGIAWAVSIRLGLALTAVVLFLGGYPAIEFESRHWFHLRFIPWWSLLLVLSAVAHVDRWSIDALRRAAMGLAVTAVALGAGLAVLRAVQTGRVRALVGAYQSAAAAPLPVVRLGSMATVEWDPQNYGTFPETRSSEMFVVTVDPARCSGTAPSAVRVVYDFDVPSHDLSTTMPLAASTGTTRLFIPVFANGLREHSYLKFRGVETVGASADCISDVSQMTDRTAIPLWIQAQVPPDADARSWYQTIRRPRILR